MISKTSARALLLGAFILGAGLSAPVLADSAGHGEPGQVINDSTSASNESIGGSGSAGNSHNPSGYNGGDGGDITAIVPGSSSSNSDGISAISRGGDGGDGYDGQPYQPGQGIPDSNECIESPEMCTEPTAEVPGGKGGNGGNGGKVDLTVTGLSEGDVKAVSAGGRYGMGGDIGDTENGTGGNAGKVTVEIAAQAIVNGNLIAESLGGKGGAAHGDDVTVTISGTVNGAVSARSNGSELAGTIRVLIDGGVVTGIISADTGAASELTFSFDVNDRTEFKAATAVLTDQHSQGTVTINGRGYHWEGFSTLVNLLRYVGPDDKVVVSVKEAANDTTNVGEPASPPRQARQQPKAEDEPAKPRIVAGIQVIEGKPEMAKCSGGSEIRTVRLDNGSVVVIHHNRGADTLIGQLEGGEFRRASGAPDWVVRVGDEGKTVDVSDASGSALTSCSFS